MQVAIDISKKRVSDTLCNAAQHRRQQRLSTIANTRIHPRKKEIAMRICEENSVCLSDYLKECLNALLRDHMQPSEFAKLLADCGEE